MALILPGSFDAKPAGALSLNRGHPLAQGLVFASVLNEIGGTRARDLVRSVESSFSGTLTWQPSGLDLTNGQAQWAHTVTCSGVGAAIACRVRCDVFQASFPFISTIGGYEGGGDDVHMIRFGDGGLDPAQAQYILGGVGAGGVKANGATILTAGKYYTLVGSFYNGKVKIYVDGREDGSTDFGGTSGNSGQVWLGMSQAAGRPIDGAINWFYMWNRGLSPAEVQEITRAPFAILSSPRRWWVNAAGGGGTSISPDAAQLSLTGSAPARLVQHLAMPAAAALLLSTAAPTVQQDHRPTPAAAQLNLSTAAPTRLIEHLITPSASNLTLSGSAPSAVQDHRPAAAAGQLTLTTAAPSLGNEITISPGVGQLTLSTTAPTRLVEHLISPGHSDLTLSGTAPTATQEHRPAPAAAALTLSATAPTVTIDHRPGIGAGTLLLTTTAPSVYQEHVASPAAAQLVLSGFAPTIGTPIIYEFLNWTNVTVTFAGLSSATVRSASLTTVTVEPE